MSRSAFRQVLTSPSSAIHRGAKTVLLLVVRLYERAGLPGLGDSRRVEDLGDVP